MSLVKKINPKNIIRAIWLRVHKRLSLRIPTAEFKNSRLGVVVAIYNRSGPLVENFLRTIDKQTLARSCFDIVFVDHDSDEEHAAAIRELCGGYNIPVIQVSRNNGKFNKSLCLNTGIRYLSPKVKYVLCTDADMILARNFLETVLRFSIQFKKAIVTCTAYRLPEGAINENTDVIDDFYRLVPLATRSTGTGACLCASTSWWLKARGFDERIPYGGEDTDLHARARRDGLLEIWVSDRTTFLHQWHEPMTISMASRGEEALQQWRDDYAANHRLLEQDQSIVRNPITWGGQP